MDEDFSGNGSVFASKWMEKDSGSLRIYWRLIWSLEFFKQKPDQEGHNKYVQQHC